MIPGAYEACKAIWYLARQIHSMQEQSSKTDSNSTNPINRKMVEIMVNQASTCDLKELVSKFIP
jgi:ribosomal protein S3AE